MNVHPTTLPEKRRPLVKKLLPKREDDVKVSKKPPWQSLTAVQTRPKRAFGVDRSSNIPVENPLAKPSLPKLDKAASKPRKPAVVASVIATKKNGPALPAATKVPPLGNSRCSESNPAKVSPLCNSGRSGSNPAKVSPLCNSGCSGSNPAKVSPLGNSGRSRSNPAKVSARKHLRVSFQEANPKPQGRSGKSEQDVILHTPMSVAKIILPETPYQTARSCSKCRLDKLETAMYWLTQIKLAELCGKHFASAAFFGVALQCQAQPFHRLQSELKRYMGRHQVLSDDFVWADLFQSYCLATNRPNADPNLNQSKVLLAGKEDSSSDSHNFGHFHVCENDDPALSFDDKLLICEGHVDGCMGHHNCKKTEEDGMEQASTKNSDSSCASDVKYTDLIANLCENKSGYTSETPNVPVDSYCEHNSYSVNCDSIINVTDSVEQKGDTAGIATSELSEGKPVHSITHINNGGNDQHKFNTKDDEKENDPN